VARIGDLSLFISAETKRATEALRQVDVVANKSTKARSIIIGAETQQAVVNIGKVDQATTQLNKSLLTTNSALKNTSGSFDAGKLASEFIYLNKRVESIKDSLNELRETLRLLGASKVVDIADSIGVTLLARFNPELFQQSISNAVIQGVQQGSDRAKGILYKNFFKGISAGISDGINNLARIGFAGQGLMFIIQPIKAAFQGLFDFTLGQNIKLQDTILSTATTLATTADVLDANGNKIVEPFERIKALQGPVTNAIDSIRERSLKLAGVTSSQVVDVFSVVATNIGQINGNLKDAEDLAIAFTASLGTLGIPLFQARQEIGSILGGYITEDSLLARRLGITNEQVREAKQKAGGVTKFILDKLSTAEAGQAILAKGFRGVTSNIAELFELIGLSIGKPLLDPLVGGLNKAFQALFNFKRLLTEIGQFTSSTIVKAFDKAFEPFRNSEYVSNLSEQFTALTLPLIELQNVTKGQKGSFLERAVLGMEPDKVPAVLDGFIKGIRSLKEEVNQAAASAGSPIASLLTDARSNTGLQNLQPQRIASLPLLDTQAFTKGWDTVRSTLEDTTASFLKFVNTVATFKIREIADKIRIFSDVVRTLGNMYLGAANFVASFAATVSQLLTLPFVQTLNQWRIATEFVGVSDLVDNVKILTVAILGFRNAVIVSSAAFQNYKAGLQGIALASKAASGTLNVTSASLASLSLSGRMFAVGGDVTARVLDKLGTALGYTQSEISRVKKEFGTMDSVVKGLKSTMKSLVGQMILTNVVFAGIQLALGAVITAISNHMEETRKQKREQEQLNRVLAVSKERLLELSESLDPADQRELTRQMSDLDAELNKLGKTIDENKIKIKAFKESVEGVEGRGIKELVAEIDAFNAKKAKGQATLTEEFMLDNKIRKSPISYANPAGTIDAYRRTIAKIAGLEKDNEKARGEQRQLIRKKEAVENQKNIKAEAELIGKRRFDLEKKIKKFRIDLNREIANKEFSMRMDNDRKRAQAELQAAQLRIRLEKQRAIDLIEGEEGASAVAKRNLAEFIAQRASAAAQRENDEKEFTISMAEMTRDLENYKIGIQEKITNMQKKVGDYQKRVAEFLLRKAKNEADVRANGSERAAQAAQTGSVSGATGLREGSTGGSTGNHFHVEGVGFTPSEAGARSIFAKDVRKQLTTTDRPGMREKHPVTRKQAYHAGFDLAGPRGSGQGLPFNLAEGFKLVEFNRQADQNSKRGAGNTGIVEGPNGVRYRVMHLADPGADFKLPKTGEQTAPTAIEDIEIPAFETDLGGDTGALDLQLERARALEARLMSIKEAVRQADTSDSFNKIADALFKLPGIENLQNEKTLLKEKLKLVGQIEDPARAKIFADIEQKRIISIREADEARLAMVEKLGEGSKELEDFDMQALARKDIFIERLNEQEKRLLSLLDLQRQLAVTSDLRDLTKSNRLDVNRQNISANFDMAAGTEFSTFGQQRALAQGRIETERLDREEQFGGPLTGDALAKFEEFAAAELVNADKLAEMQGLQERFQQLGEIASGVGSAISEAFTQGFADILSGAASVQDVLGNMFKGIADSFMQMATKIIADMIKMLALKTLLSLFGGGSGPAPAGLGGGGGLNLDGISQYMDGAGGGLLKFAKGGVVTGPTAAMIGEGGMNEAVVPLPNGKAIPVDFGKKGKMGGGDTNTNITVNVDQSGNTDTSTTGDQAGKLGKAIDGAVKRVIMEERRSGGLLFNGRR
jgi:hypothetical protein